MLWTGVRKLREINIEALTSDTTIHILFALSTLFTAKCLCNCVQYNKENFNAISSSSNVCNLKKQVQLLDKLQSRDKKRCYNIISVLL